MQPTEIINRYVYAVGEHLPKKSRADIQAELKSLLLETLDARAESEGCPVDQNMTAGVLREFGEPEVVAQRYVPVRPLISAGYVPLFVLVLKIVVSVITVLFVITTGLALLSLPPSSQEGVQVLLDAFSNYASAVVSNVGIVVIVFFVIERVQSQPPKLTSEKWDPLKLPAIGNPNRLNRGEVITTIVMNIVLLAILNLSPNWFSYFIINDGVWSNFQVFGPGFFQYVFLINLTCFLEIGVHLFVLGRGRWSRATRLAEIASGGFSIYVLARMLTDGVMLGATPTVDTFVRLGVLAALMVVMVDVAVNSYRLITTRWNSTDGRSDLEFVHNGPR